MFPVFFFLMALFFFLVSGCFPKPLTIQTLPTDLAKIKYVVCEFPDVLLKISQYATLHNSVTVSLVLGELPPPTGRCWYYNNNTSANVRVSDAKKH